MRRKLDWAELRILPNTDLIGVQLDSLESSLVALIGLCRIRGLCLV